MLAVPTEAGLPAPCVPRPASFAARLLASLLLGLAAWGVSPALRAQNAASAIPEFIDLGEAELATPAGAELAAAQAAFRERLGADREGALEIAKRIVALTTEAYGDSHDHVARALTNLAIVQAEDADFETAIENYAAAIRVRQEASGSIVSADLINPLRGLASAYVALDQVERAIPAYERAIHISHVNDGPENLDQVEIIDALSRVYYFSGDLENAGDMQDAIFRLRERGAEDNPDQYLDALEQRSEWYVRLGEYEKALRSYRRLRRATSEQYGKDDVRLIEPLLALADAAYEQAVNNQRSSGFSTTTGARSPSANRIGGLSDPRAFNDLLAEARRCNTRACAESVMARADATAQVITEGRGALNRAVRIARAHSAESPARLARTLVRQGDWLASLDQSRDARRRYREAWGILDEDPALHATRDELFGAPVSVARVRFRAAYGERSSGPADPARYPDRGHADIAFDVDKQGRPKNVRIVSAEPAGLMDQHLKREMRRARFRPAFSEGDPRTVTGLVYRHPFRYDASGLKNKERKRIERTTYDADAASEKGALRSIELDLQRDDGLAEDTPLTESAAPAEPGPTT